MYNTIIQFFLTNDFNISISLSCFLINSDNRPTHLMKNETQPHTLEKTYLFVRMFYRKIYNYVQHALIKDTKENYTHSSVLLQKLAKKKKVVFCKIVEHSYK